MEHQGSLYSWERSSCRSGASLDNGHVPVVQTVAFVCFNAEQTKSTALWERPCTQCPSSKSTHQPQGDSWYKTWSILKRKNIDTSCSNTCSSGPPFVYDIYVAAGLFIFTDTKMARAIILFVDSTTVSIASTLTCLLPGLTLGSITFKDTQIQCCCHRCHYEESGSG